VGTGVLSHIRNFTTIQLIGFPLYMQAKKYVIIMVAFPLATLHKIPEISENVANPL
jgi:hypothetical protein